MKKITALFAAVMICLSTLVGCNSGGETAKSDKTKIVTTSFSAYDWAKNIIGDASADYSLKLLNDNGADMHSYQPTTDDVISISECDLFIYVGGESDAWVTDVLKTAVNRDMTVINMLDVLGEATLQEEYTEGMEHSHNDSETHNHTHTDNETDEHIWLSLKNAVKITEKIAASLESIDSENADLFKTNADGYVKKLKTLDETYTEKLSEKENGVLIVCDRFPFRYLTEDYSLEYFACFSGCSTETDASFDSVIFLASKIDELDIGTVFVIEGSDKKIADTVIDNTKKKSQKTVTLNSIQSVRAENINNGLSYLTVMEDNLSKIAESFSN